MNDSSSIEIPVASVRPDALASGDFAFPWIPDQGDGTYRNPIIYATIRTRMSCGSVTIFTWYLPASTARPACRCCIRMT